MADESNGFDAFMAFVDGNGKTEDRRNETTTVKYDESHSSTQKDVIDEEEAKEREVMMKAYHPSLKQWFRENPDLVEKYGEYPVFWQELKEWKPYRDVLKAYLKVTEGGNSRTSDLKVEEQDSSKVTSENTSTQEASRRRRKSRWGDPIDESGTTGEETKRKKSRWAPTGVNLGLAALNNNAHETIKLRAKLDLINQKLTTVAIDAVILEKDPNRSPSPPPQYDSNGKRVNTREVRMRESLERARQVVVEELVRINPLFKPPADYMRQKLNRKIYIPIKQFPNYNFIGLIIGPRGNTQKRMERETNCKIAIRGRGSIKEGSKGKKLNADDNDDLHVLITGDRDDELDRAAREIQSLLVPVDDTKNSHKQKQLRELALINGTLRDDDFCHICGEKGHRQWECPNREQTFKPVSVKCAICGDASHPTRDCTQKKKTADEAAAIDKEYMSFMQQLGEKSVISSADKTVETAPWLQPVKSANNAQSWMTSQTSGAPGTISAPPGTESTAAPVMNAAGAAFPAPGLTPATAFPPPGSTPATAFPPPVAPTMHDYSQMQAWNAQQWPGYYYAGWTGAPTAAECQYVAYGGLAAQAAPIPVMDPAQYPQQPTGTGPNQ
uniref:Branchpoint-bridging protein n=1 Tax=Albugo laibachii Nc14 TaxID=890382 RepID=F0W3F8_9STRA|nr:branchpointbridging protein putative [Albugo laibachii Nc14]CCA16339.1 branchpointbridging protein putative [Albugo laibachii Nc14]|eukprot:CCA16339.1 branchpointbridging protein putative [Albugo laibachii Nc14]